jgi:hypothetical protein
METIYSNNGKHRKNNIKGNILAKIKYIKNRNKILFFFLIEIQNNKMK